MRTLKLHLRHKRPILGHQPAQMRADAIHSFVSTALQKYVALQYFHIIVRFQSGPLGASKNH